VNKDGYNISEFYVCIVNGCPKKSLSYAWLLNHYYSQHKQQEDINVYTKK